MSDLATAAPAEREVPIIRPEEYKKDMESWTHWASPTTTKLTGAHLAAAVGMKGYGVNYLQLEPDTESCTPHYHLQESEWIYILKGSATLHIIDASLDRFTKRHMVTPQTKVAALQVKDYEVKAGDFIGFQAGPQAAKYAHGLRGGPEGCEFLCGGDDAKHDTCVYPTIGVARMYDEAAGGSFHLPSFDEAHPLPVSPPAEPARDAEEGSVS